MLAPGNSLFLLINTALGSWPSALPLHSSLSIHHTLLSPWLQLWRTGPIPEVNSGWAEGRGKPWEQWRVTHTPFPACWWIPWKLAGLPSEQAFPMTQQVWWKSLDKVTTRARLGVSTPSAECTVPRNRLGDAGEMQWKAPCKQGRNG